MKQLAMALLVLGLVACHGKQAETTPPAETQPVAAAQDDGLMSGIPACDLWMEKYTRCIDTKAPESARPQMRDAMKQTAASWRETAATPEGKDALEKACEQMLVATKQAVEQLGCEW